MESRMEIPAAVCCRNGWYSATVKTTVTSAWPRGSFLEETCMPFVYYPFLVSTLSCPAEAGHPLPLRERDWVGRGYLCSNVNSGRRTSVNVESNLMSTCSDGPAVSLNGSPTVSPTTAALCTSDPLPPYTPVSMYFLALSQAPPPLLSTSARSTPVMVPTINVAATASLPSRIPTSVGTATAMIPGSTICLSAPRVAISTQRA